MATYIKRYRSNGREYVYFRPPAKMSRAKIRPRRLAVNQVIALAEVEKLLREWIEPGRRKQYHTWHTKVLQLARGAKQRARLKKRQFRLTARQLADMLRDQHYRCAVTGLPFDLAPQRETLWRHPMAPSLDRRDVAAGYSVDNVRLVLACINVAMGEWGEELFYQVAEAALEHRRERERNRKASKAVSKSRSADHRRSVEQSI